MKSPTIKDRITRSASLLPTSICLAVVLWYIENHEAAMCWEGFFACLTSAYSLRKLNNGNILMPARSWIVPSLLILIFASMKEYHPLDTSFPAVFFYLFSIYFLLQCWKQEHQERLLFNSCVFLSLAALFFPPIIFLVIIHLIAYQSYIAPLSLRTFLAAMLGIIAPIEIVVATAIACDKTDLILESFSMLYTFTPSAIFDWSVLHMIGFMCIIFFLGLGLIHFYTVLPTERIKIRLSFYALIMESAALLMLTILMPQNGHQLMALLIALCCPFLGHYLVFSRGWYSNLMAIVVALLIMLLIVINFVLI